MLYGHQQHRFRKQSLCLIDVLVVRGFLHIVAFSDEAQVEIFHFGPAKEPQCQAELEGGLLARVLKKPTVGPIAKLVVSFDHFLVGFVPRQELVALLHPVQLKSKPATNQ